MNKIFKKFMVLGGSALIGMTSFTSCSSFFGDDSYSIVDTKTQIDEKTGDTIVTITFSDGKDPLTFTIPKKISGTDGVGIESITSEMINNNVILTITYTDHSMSPTKISVPVVKGDTGVGIKEVEVSQDLEGNTVIVFVYTDNTRSNNIVIPKGIDGEDGMNGIGILSVDSATDTDGNLTLTITYTDSSLPPTTITLRNGHDGVGIETIVYDEDRSNDTTYVLDILFDDGTSTRVSLPRPQSVSWYALEGAPDNNLGKEGDFYINILNGNIYHKNSPSSWAYMFTMKGTGSTEQQTVVFIANGGRFEKEETLGDNKKTYVVEYGSYLNLENIPVPTYDDTHIFDGWWTSKDVNNPNSGHFTDLTPIQTNMNLYARWKIV